MTEFKTFLMIVIKFVHLLEVVFLLFHSANHHIAIKRDYVNIVDFSIMLRMKQACKNWFYMQTPSLKINTAWVASINFATAALASPVPACSASDTSSCHFRAFSSSIVNRVIEDICCHQMAIPKISANTMQGDAGMVGEVLTQWIS